MSNGFLKFFRRDLIRLAVSRGDVEYITMDGASPSTPFYCFLFFCHILFFLYELHNLATHIQFFLWDAMVMPPISFVQTKETGGAERKTAARRCVS